MKKVKKPSRREFLKVAGASSLGLLLSHLPTRWVGGVYAADAPETTKIRFGIIALTDCSSIVMAHELGLFKKYGIESTISKEASLGGDPRQVNARREPGNPYAVRYAVRFVHGAARFAGEADDHSV